MRESRYQAGLIDRLRALFPGCFILKNDPTYIQGVPDIILLFENQWAMLEVKATSKSSVQPNQLYYIEQLNHMSFASFISPSTEEDVLYELQQSFGLVR